MPSFCGRYLVVALPLPPHHHKKKQKKMFGKWNCEKCALKSARRSCKKKSKDAKTQNYPKLPKVISRTNMDQLASPKFQRKMLSTSSKTKTILLKLIPPGTKLEKESKNYKK